MSRPPVQFSLIQEREECLCFALLSESQLVEQAGLRGGERREGSRVASEDWQPNCTTEPHLSLRHV